MKKLGSIISIMVISIVFIYAMIYLSNNNKCSGVRVYDCQKEDNKDIVDEDTYFSLKVTGDIFLKNCEPIIKEKDHVYILDYSSCDLNVTISKEQNWVKSVELNGSVLSREEINNNFINYEEEILFKTK